MKTIKFSLHAEQRRRQRGISEQQIIEVIERPEYFKTMPDGKRVAVKKIQNRTLTAIYKEEENFINVITVF